jgi:hypothetical protein
VPLARESFTLVEQLLPERTTVTKYYSLQQEQTNSRKMVIYAEWLAEVKTTNDWQRVNEDARRDFATLPGSSETKN